MQLLHSVRRYFWESGFKEEADLAKIKDEIGFSANSRRYEGWLTEKHLGSSHKITEGKLWKCHLCGRFGNLCQKHRQQQRTIVTSSGH